MEREDFIALVHRLEERSRRRPLLYKVQVTLLTLAAYVYIILALVVLLCLFAITVLASFVAYLAWLTIPIAIAAAATIVLAVRAFWFRVTPPEGVAITSVEAPVLFREITSVAAVLATPEVDEVLIYSDFNAALVQRPRLGILGWQKNTLLLGLTLMEAHSPSQFRSVLAHELAHLSRNHARFSAWIYRVRATWSRVVANLERNERQRTSQFQVLIRLFKVFFRRYMPYFDAYSFVLRRAHEYDADRCAAEITSSRDRADSLLVMQLKSRYIVEHYWPSVFALVRSQPEPPGDAFTQLYGRLRTPVPTESVDRWLQQGLQEKTDPDDTHPCLTERLAGLGQNLSPPETPEYRKTLEHLNAPLSPSAAEFYVGSACGRMRAELDRRWRESIRDEWQSKHSELQRAQARLAVLEEEYRDQLPVGEKLWELARLRYEVRGADAALPTLNLLRSLDPSHFECRYLLGQILLERNDPSGIPHLEAVTEGDPYRAVAACQLLYNFLRRSQRSEEAESYRQRAIGQQQLLNASYNERSRLAMNDRFLPATLATDAVRTIAREIKQKFPQVEGMYLITKELQFLPAVPYHALILKRKPTWVEWSVRRKDMELQKRIVEEVALPPHCYVWVLKAEQKKLWRKIRAVAGAEIYRC